MELDDGRLAALLARPVRRGLLQAFNTEGTENHGALPLVAACFGTEFNNHERCPGRWLQRASPGKPLRAAPWFFVLKACSRPRRTDLGLRPGEELSANASALTGGETVSVSKPGHDGSGARRAAFGMRSLRGPAQTDFIFVAMTGLDVLESNMRSRNISSTSNSSATMAPASAQSCVMRCRVRTWA
jgi:hypothetical protein